MKSRKQTANAMLGTIALLAVLWMAAAYVFEQLGELHGDDVVIMGHWVYLWLANHMNASGIAVDILYVIAGISLADTMWNDRDAADVEDGKIVEAGQFPARLLKGLLPAIVVFIVIGVLLNGICGLQWSNWGIQVVTSGLVAALLLYFLCRGRKDDSSFLVSVVIFIAIGLQAYFWRRAGVLAADIRATTSFYMRVIRALMGMSVGIFIAWAAGLVDETKAAGTVGRWLDKFPKRLVEFLEFCSSLVLPLLATFTLAAEVLYKYVWTMRESFVLRRPILNVLVAAVLVIGCGWVCGGMLGRGNPSCASPTATHEELTRRT